MQNKLAVKSIQYCCGRWAGDSIASHCDIAKNFFVVLFALLTLSTSSLRAAEEDLCVKGHHGEFATIAFVGDLIFQNPLQEIALTRSGSYRQFWRKAEPIFNGVDAVYANLEGTLARNISYLKKRTAYPGRTFRSDVYASPPEILNFNYHFSLADDLKSSGFRVISTGNNHALDRGTEGIDQTIATLKQVGLSWVGTRAENSTRRPWGKTIKIGALTTGWVACSYGTNGFADRSDQVLDCYRERESVIAAIRRLVSLRDVAAVFLVPHWGIENSLVVTERQRSLAREAVEAGATAVVGTHPHILQRWEWVESPDGKEVPILYSTGNFISAQEKDFQRRGMILILTIRRRPHQLKGRIASIQYLLSAFRLSEARVQFIDYSEDKHAELPREHFISAHSWIAARAQCD